MKKEPYYEGPRGCERIAIVIIMLSAIISCVMLFNSCAYQRYNARSFRPTTKAQCKTYSDVDGHGKKYYYKQR